MNNDQSFTLVDELRLDAFFFSFVGGTYPREITKPLVISRY